MTTLDMREALNAKINELNESIERMRTSGVAESTLKTQTYQKTHEIHNLQIMFGLTLCCPDEVTLNEDVTKWFKSTTTLVSERTRGVVVEVHEGDKVMDVLQKYNTVKDIYKEIQSACAKAGLKINLDTIVKE